MKWSKSLPVIVVLLIAALVLGLRLQNWRLIRREGPKIKTVMQQYNQAYREGNVDLAYAQMVPVEAGSKISRSMIEYAMQAWTNVFVNNAVSVEFRVQYVNLRSDSGIARVNAVYTYPSGCKLRSTSVLYYVNQTWRIFDSITPDLSITPNLTIDEALACATGN